MSDDVTVDGSPSVDRGRFPTAVTPWDDEAWRMRNAAHKPCYYNCLTCIVVGSKRRLLSAQEHPTKEREMNQKLKLQLVVISLVLLQRSVSLILRLRAHRCRSLQQLLSV